MREEQKSTSFKDTEKYKMGHTWELKISEFLQSKGYFIIPSYDYSGVEDDKSPKLQGKLKAFIIPDLDVSKQGKRTWVEVKSKTKADLHKKTQTLVHGIPLRHYNHYKEIQNITGCEVLLFICEEETGDILYSKLDDLVINHKYDGDKMSYGGMIFFKRDCFKKFKTPN